MEVYSIGSTQIGKTKTLLNYAQSALREEMIVFINKIPAVRVPSILVTLK